MDTTQFAEHVKYALDRAIAELSSTRELFLRNPETDFTRVRKISFEDFIRICIQFGSKSLQNELLDYFGFDSDKIPSKAAFIQQRAKVAPDAFEFLLHEFNGFLESIDNAFKTKYGYRILACDGSTINIPYNPEDEETFQRNGNNKGFNQLHFNGLYDVMNGIYVDWIFDPGHKLRERANLEKMLDRYRSSVPSIFLADRGYEGYNVFASFLNSKHSFVIRMKDPESNGILSTYEFDYDNNGEFDYDIETTLTCRQTTDIKAMREKYTFVSKDKLDFYTDDNPYFPMKFRVLCIKVAPGKYEYIATNLDRDEFAPDMIKDLYHLRWDIMQIF